MTRENICGSFPAAPYAGMATAEFEDFSDFQNRVSQS